jgi:hypothetical protein
MALPLGVALDPADEPRELARFVVIFGFLLEPFLASSSSSSGFSSSSWKRTGRKSSRSRKSMSWKASR